LFLAPVVIVSAIFVNKFINRTLVFVIATLTVLAVLHIVCSILVDFGYFIGLAKSVFVQLVALLT